MASSKDTERILVDEVKACNDRKYAPLRDLYENRLKVFVKSKIDKQDFRDPEFIIEESVTNTFLKVYFALKMGQPTKSEAFAGYLYTTASRCLIDQVRASKPNVIHVEDVNQIEDTGQLDTNEQVRIEQTLEVIRDRFTNDSAIKPEDKKIIELHFFSGLTRQEIAETLKENIKHVDYIIGKFVHKILPTYLADL